MINMVNTNEKVFSQVYEILKILGGEYIDKLPTKLYAVISNSKDDDYAPAYTLEKSFKEQNIEKQTISIITLLHLNYWCNYEKEKDALKRLLKNNDAILQEELSIKYNTDNIFKDRQIKLENSTELVEVKKKTRLEKVINFFRRLLKLK